MNKVKSARLRLGLSQKKVADSVGMTTGAISLIESGGRTARPPNARLISDLLGIPVEDVLFPEEKRAA